MGKKKKHKDHPHKFFLYENSVQDVETQGELLLNFYQQTKKSRQPIVLKEDFCGTAALCSHWVQMNERHTAYGIDLDKETLSWSNQNHIQSLSAHQQERVQLIHDDVNNISSPKADLVVAFNFSYYIFKTRERLKQYFSNAYRSLTDNGVFIIDAFGGTEAFDDLKEERECEGFTYIWEQSDYDPITNNLTCKIHFKLPNKTKIKNAFTYDWRIWTLPEIHELLIESGFSKVLFYFEDIDEDGDGNGEFKLAERGEAMESWLAYLVAIP